MFVYEERQEHRNYQCAAGGPMICEAISKLIKQFSEAAAAMFSTGPSGRAGRQ